MKTSLKAASLAAALALAVWASPASAQRADDMKGQGQHPCAGDAQRLCGEFIPDRGKIATCLSQKKRELSPACGAIIGGGKSATRHGKGKRHGHRRRHRR
jgi:uncharacterized membrane protein